MIRIRFFGPRELNQNGFSGAQYKRKKNWSLTHFLDIGTGRDDFKFSGAQANELTNKTDLPSPRTNKYTMPKCESICSGSDGLPNLNLAVCVWPALSPKRASPWPVASFSPKSRNLWCKRHTWTRTPQRLNCSMSSTKHTQTMVV